MKKQILVGVLVIVLSAIGGFAVSFARLGDIAQEQYYRGAYDVCVMFALRVFSKPPQASYSSCLQNIAFSYETDWYGTETIGYEWPLPAYEGE